MRPILSPPRAQQDGLLVERQLQLRLALDVLNPEALCPLIRSSEARSVRASWKAWIWTSRTGMGSGSIPRSVYGTEVVGVEGFSHAAQPVLVSALPWY